jgi:predicted nucleic acid-binding protein
MKYLVDTSALTRIVRRQVDPEWHDIAGRGLITICEPALAETLVTADAKKYAELEADLRDTYPFAAVPDNVWELVAVIRRELALHSTHQGLSVADLVIAATAIRLKLTVLHEDADFETVGRYVSQLQQRRVSAGPE